jgi:hypothetical protein
MRLNELPPTPPATPSNSRAGLWDYLKAAFSWRGNLLALAAGVAASFISGRPDVVLPFVAAGEMAYLALLTSIPKFRSAVDMRKFNARKRGPEAQSNSDDQVVNILKDLAPGLRTRFVSLRERCMTMQRLSQKIGGSARFDPTRDEMRNEGLDKMLWVFLRLLYAQQGLWRFLEETNASELESQLKKLEERRTALGETPDERLKKSLTDAIATATMRLDNVRGARNNADFVELELDRIEGKIMALSEMSVNNSNPDFISTQVDAVADSMTATESAMQELNYLTGLSADINAPPPRILATQTR